MPSAFPPSLPAIFTQGNATPVSTTGTATLSSSTTYYVPVGGEFSAGFAFHLWWDSAIALIASIEDTLFAASDVADHVADVKWVPEDPSTALVGKTSGSIANATLTVTAGTAGSALWHFGNDNALRTRWKIAVQGTGGVIQVRHFQKVPFPR